jgi:hypothetical protein
MAIIYSYPEKTTPAGNDFLVITDSEQLAPNKNRTKSLTIDNLANYVVTSVSGITGSGTLNTIAMFTPDGQTVGDSFITQEVFAPGTGSEESRITINNPSPGPGSNGNFLIVNTGRFGRIETDTIVASDTGSVTMNGNVNIGNASTDELNILSTTNIWNAKIKTGVPFGFFAPDEDYVLTSTVGSTLVWTSQDDYVSGAIVKMIPYITTATPGGSETYSADNNIVKIGWSGGNGVYVINLPSATAIPYRVIRFTTNGTYPGGGAHKVRFTPTGGETIDGTAYYEISKAYEGISIWSTGTEWVVIQAKAH